MLRTCAGISSGPSAVWVKSGSPSGTFLDIHVSRSRMTAGSAFSQSINEALVCLMNTWHRPVSIADSLTAACTSRVRS